MMYFPTKWGTKELQNPQITEDLVWPFYGALFTSDVPRIETDGDSAFLE